MNLADPELPYTPTETGRKSKVGYLGMHGVDFGDLWPLLAGLVGSLALGFEFFIGTGWHDGHWAAKSAVALVPVGAGYGYLRGFVVGRPPHFKGDLWAAALNLWVDFSDPPLRWLPIMPRLRADLTSAAGPWRPRERLHPRLALAEPRE